jgi:hypothetical protein
LKIEDLWMSLRSAFFMIFLQIEPAAGLKPEHRHLKPEAPYNMLSDKTR